MSNEQCAVRRGVLGRKGPPLAGLGSPQPSVASTPRSPQWWQAFEAERQEARLRDAARLLHDAPALDAFSTEAAAIAEEILVLVSGPSAALTAREWRAVQEQATRLLALARLAEAYVARG